MILLSYPLDEKTPLYGSTLPIQFTRDRSFDKGDTCNTQLVTLSNHSGTHIDTPRHFFKDGKTVCDLLEQVNTYNMTCINVKKEVHDTICTEDLIPFTKNIQNAEALFLRTGFYQYRENASLVYKTKYPEIDQSIPNWLKENCKNLRIFGLDCISVGNPINKEIGRKVHRSFLGGERSILIVEDVNLSNTKITEGMWVLLLIPLFVASIDATPVTLFTYPLD